MATATPFDELCKRIFQFPPTANDMNLNPISNLFLDMTGLFIIDGQMWTSVLQYFYYQKFIFDHNEKNNVLKTHDIKELIKKFSKPLPSFKTRIWSSYRAAVLKRAMYAKFEQNIKMFYMLMNIPMSAIVSISDEIVVESNMNPLDAETFGTDSTKETLKFEMDSIRYLTEIREYFKTNGHPLVDTKSGEYKPRVLESIRRYKSPIRDPKLYSSEGLTNGKNNDDDQLSSSV